MNVAEAARALDCSKPVVYHRKLKRRKRDGKMQFLVKNGAVNVVEPKVLQEFERKFVTPALGRVKIEVELDNEQAQKLMVLGLKSLLSAGG
jgi:hypothetical protein